MTGLQISKALYKILSSDAALTAIVGTKIFPIVANSGTTYPFLVYKRRSVVPSTSKDVYVYSDEVTVTIYVMGATYTESIEVADLVRSALQYTTGTFEGIEINDISMTNADEEYISDAFVQSLTFQIKIV